MSLFIVVGYARAFALIAIFATLSLSIAHADDPKPFLHPLFTDNMVLQRGISDPIWGWTKPGETVTVSISNGRATLNLWNPVTAVAGPDGKWLAKLPALPVGTTYSLTITSYVALWRDPYNFFLGKPVTINGLKPRHSVTLHDVAVGDVWLCSGQSNMEFGIGNALNGPAEVAAAKYPSVRLFTVSKAIGAEPKALLTGSWQVCTPQTVASEGTWNGFSAVGYFFGRDLQQNLHVPIGLIQSSWGGTFAESWTSAEALRTLPDFQPTVEFIQKAAARKQNAAMQEAWYARHDSGSAGKTWADPGLNDSGWKTMTLPQFFQDAGDPEIAHVNGVVWFRRTFDLPADFGGKNGYLHYLADDIDTVWVNGTKIGATGLSSVARAYTVPASLLKPTGNVIAIRVLDTGGKSGITGGGLYLEFVGTSDGPLAGAWRYRFGAPLPADDPAPIPLEGNQNMPTVLYNSMIAPLVPFRFKGALWYQGESNVGRGKQYQTLLPTMNGDWRKRFGVGDFPFLIVQLANIGDPPAQPGESAWAELREAQLLTSQRLPKAGLAVTVDIGEAHNIHPPNKQEVGRRLSLVAQAIAYGQKIEYSGPIYQSMTVEGGAIRLKFSHVGGGLVVKGGDKLTGFAIAGADGKFVWAEAKIDGATVVVSSPTVAVPMMVRYGWADNPVCNLYNQAGLPASPFRTDGEH